MSTIREILRTKGSTVWSIGPDATVFEALELLAAKNIGAALVAENGKPVGIFSERDYARKVILLDRSSRQTSVREIMSPDPVCIGPQNSVDEAMAVMTARRFRHLPVVEEGQLIGIVSIGDVVKAKIADQEFMIGQLERYISR